MSSSLPCPWMSSIPPFLPTITGLSAVVLAEEDDRLMTQRRLAPPILLEGQASVQRGKDIIASIEAGWNESKTAAAADNDTTPKTTHINTAHQDHDQYDTSDRDVVAPAAEGTCTIERDLMTNTASPVPSDQIHLLNHTELKHKDNRTINTPATRNPPGKTNRRKSRKSMGPAIPATSLIQSFGTQGPLWSKVNSIHRDLQSVGLEHLKVQVWDQLTSTDEIIAFLEECQGHFEQLDLLVPVKSFPSTASPTTKNDTSDMVTDAIRDQDSKKATAEGLSACSVCLMIARSNIVPFSEPLLLSIVKFIQNVPISSSSYLALSRAIQDYQCLNLIVKETESCLIPMTFTCLDVIFSASSKGLAILVETCVNYLIAVYENHTSYRAWLLDEICSRSFDRTDVPDGKYTITVSVGDVELHSWSYLLLRIFTACPASLKSTSSYITTSLCDPDVEDGVKVTLVSDFIEACHANVETCNHSVLQVLSFFLDKLKVDKSLAGDDKKSIGNPSAEKRNTVDKFFHDLLLALTCMTHLPAVAHIALSVTRILASRMDEHAALVLDWLSNLIKRLSDIVPPNKKFADSNTSEIYSCLIQVTSPSSPILVCKWVKEALPPLPIPDDNLDEKEHIFNTILGYSQDIQTASSASREHILSDSVSLISLRLLYLSDLVAHVRTLKALFLAAIDSPLALIRSKALKSILVLISCEFTDTSLYSSILNALASRLLDSSPSVRESAIECFAKVIVSGDNGSFKISSEDRLKLLLQWYEPLSQRILDVGLGIRKRVLRFLKDLFFSCPHDEAHIVIYQDLIKKVALRTGDSEESVQSLARKLLSEIIFSGLPEIKPNVTWEKQGEHLRYEIMYRTRLLQTLAPIIQLSDLGLTESCPESIITSMKYYTDCSIDALIVSSEVNIIPILQLLNQFFSLHPKSLQGHESTLQPYLKPALAMSFTAGRKSDLTESEINFLVLKILVRADFSLMDMHLVEELEADLLSILNKINMKSLRLAIDLLHSLVGRSQNTFKIQKVIKSCFSFVTSLNQEEAEMDFVSNCPQSLSPSDKLKWRCLFIMSCICSKDDIQTLDPAITAESVYSLIMAQNQADLTLSLSVLSPLFLSQPKLLLEQKSIDLCKKCLAESPLELLRFLLEFVYHSLKSDSAQFGTKQDVVRKHVNLTDGIKQEDYGIASGLLQTHLPSVLELCLRREPAIRQLAFDLVCISLEQGLVHPLLCIPTVIAMQAFDHSNLGEKAESIHSKMAGKYPSFIHSRNLDGLRLLFDTLQKVSLPDSKSYSASLHSFFSIIRLKRALKYETLLSIIECFDLKLESPHDNPPTTPGAAVSETFNPSNNAKFCEFLAQQLTQFPFKYQEEISFVIAHAFRVLGAVGTIVRDRISSSAKAEWCNLSSQYPSLTDITLSLAALMNCILTIRSHFNVEHVKLDVLWPKDMRQEKHLLKSQSSSPNMISVSPSATNDSGLNIVQLYCEFLVLIDRLDHDVKMRTPAGSPQKRKESVPSTLKRTKMQASTPLSVPIKRSKRAKRDVTYQESSDDEDGGVHDDENEEDDFTS